MWKQSVTASAKHVLGSYSSAQKDDKLASLSKAIALYRLSVSDATNNDKFSRLLEGDEELQQCISVSEGNRSVSYVKMTAHIDAILSDSFFRPDDGAGYGEDQVRPNTTKPSHTTNIIKQLQTELPSRRKNLSHFIDERREPIDDPREMGDMIEEAWGPLWARRSSEEAPSQRQLIAYLSHYRKRVPSHLLPPIPSTAEIQEVIEGSGDSSPGRDGIPFSAYRSLIDTILPIMVSLMQAIARGVPPPAGFNHGRLYLIPKDTTHHVLNTRPITVNNSVNRLLSSAITNAIAPALEYIIDSSQKGFIPGRRGDEHVVDLNYDFYHSMREKHPRYNLFLDTKKAFDSIDHAYIKTMVRQVGFPMWVSIAIAALLSDVLVFPILKAKVPNAIPISRGVKQGCPLSPLLFALCYDPLLHYLRRLKNELFPPSSALSPHLTRNTLPSQPLSGLKGASAIPPPPPSAMSFYAFADDLAVSSSSIHPILRSMKIISEFGRYSGLGINTDKTTVIKNRNFSRSDRSLFSASVWPDIKLSLQHVYLGVLQGRNVKLPMIFEGALGKFYERLAYFRPTIRVKPLHIRVVIFNVYLIPLFSYLIHFFIMPRHITKAIQRACHTAIVPFNGGGFGYIHLIAPSHRTGTTFFALKQPLRDIYAANVTALTSHVDLDDFDGMTCPATIPHLPYLSNGNWETLIINDHRLGAALDFLWFNHALDLTTNTITAGSKYPMYGCKSRTRNMYRDFLVEAYHDDLFSTLKGKSHAVSIPNKLLHCWGITHEESLLFPHNGRFIAPWVPAHVRVHQIKLNFRALATDHRRRKADMPVPTRSRGRHLPCYICGDYTDSVNHIYLHCAPVVIARHVFMEAISVNCPSEAAFTLCTAPTPLGLATASNGPKPTVSSGKEVLVCAGCGTPMDGRPHPCRHSSLPQGSKRPSRRARRLSRASKLISATMVFNWAIWNSSRTLFHTLPHAPSTSWAARKLYAYAIAHWDLWAPLAHRSTWDYG
jgi:hypothetical protein